MGPSPVSRPDGRCCRAPSLRLARQKGAEMRPNRHFSMLGTIVLAVLTVSQALLAAAAETAYPQGLLVLPGNGQVAVNFQGVRNASGYNVYRRQMGQQPEQAGSTDHRDLFVDSGPDGQGLVN